MDIRNWPLDRIMQLPDCCFGRRFQISVTCEGLDGAAAWDISEIALPEKCVLWEWGLFARELPASYDSVRLALGDQLPTTTAMMDVLDPMLPGYGLQGAEPRVIMITRFGPVGLRKLKFPIAAAGRRVVLEVTGAETFTPIACFVFSFSSIPTEVPDWLISGPGRGL